METKTKLKQCYEPIKLQECIDATGCTDCMYQLKHQTMVLSYKSYTKGQVGIQCLQQNSMDQASYSSVK